MAFAYDKSDIHARYDAGRTLSPRSTNALMEFLARRVPLPVRLAVDLGCGTGRFTTALCETFDVPVVGVEPAANMRSTAEAKPHPPAVRFVAGCAHQIPLEAQSADLIFMSQVFHHLENAEAALHEIHRVLAPEGRLCLRQTTAENLDSYFYQRFFPEARAIDEERLPARGALSEMVRACGFRIETVQTFQDEIAATGAEYVEKIATRSYSDLECIPDESFNRGLNALRAYCEACPEFPRFAENDLFLFSP